MTTQPVLFPDIEEVLTGWLPGALRAVYGVTAQVMTETPYDLQDRVPLIGLHRATGTDDQAIIDRPVVSVDAFGATRAAANLLGRQVHALLHGQLQGAVAGGAVIGWVNTVAGPRWMPYADLAVRRFNATYEMYVKPAPA